MDRTTRMAEELVRIIEESTDQKKETLPFSQKIVNFINIG